MLYFNMPPKKQRIGGSKVLLAERADNFCFAEVLWCKIQLIVRDPKRNAVCFFVTSSTFVVSMLTSFRIDGSPRLLVMIIPL